MTIYGRLCTNGFNILDPEMISIGTGIYLGVSIVDHSCKPNAVATFEGLTLKLRLTEDLTFQHWSQINISYIDLINTREDRRKELKNAYYFLCTCSKCVDTKEEEEMLAAACPNSKCEDFITNLSELVLHECRNCGQNLNDEFVESYKEVMDFTKGKLEEMKSVSCKIFINFIFSRITCFFFNRLGCSSAMSKKTRECFTSVQHMACKDFRCGL